jgi:hypothetical protein
MENNTYNGWRNRETWLVPLWWNECPVESIDADTREEAVEALVEHLEGIFDELLDECNIPSVSLIADLLNGAVARIDWREIAEHWVDDIQLNLPESDETETEEVES